MKPRTAVFPVAGFGTRFLPASKAIPKELLPIVDKPAVQYVVEEAVTAGLDTAIFVTAEGKSAIEDHFDRNLRLESFLAERGKNDLLQQVRAVGSLVNVAAVRQKEALGLGHAVLQAAPLLGSDPFAVLLGDDVVIGHPPAISRLLELHEASGAPIVAVMEVPPEEIHHYGCVAGEPVGDGVWRVRNLVEKPRPEEAPSNLAIIGRYVLTNETLGLLARTPPGKSGEIQLTDGLRLAAEEGEVLACTFPGERFDAGNKLDFLRAVVALALDDAELGPDFRKIVETLLAREPHKA